MSIYILGGGTGVVMVPTGQVLHDAEGRAYSEMIAQTGFHVNSTRRLEGLDAYLVYPESPSMEFFGAETHYYRFDDESQAKSLLHWTDSEGYRPVYAPPPKTIPERVTRLQGKQIMIKNNMLHGIISAIDSVEDALQRELMRSYLEDSAYYLRHHPVTEALGEAAGLSPIQMDGLFIEAAEVE